MPDYKISILIPSWNGEPYIEKCINSLLTNDYRFYQIISIAGGTDNGFEKSLKIQEKHPNFVVTLPREKGKKNEALNLGLEKADGDIIVITDVDCIYPKHWLRKINEIFQKKKVNVITGFNLPYQYLVNSLGEFNRIRIGYKLVSFNDGDVIIGNKLWGGNSAFRKDVFFNKIGKFEVDSITGDDKILGMEFNKRGEDIYFFRDIFVYTEHYSQNLKKFIDHRIRWARDLFIEIKFKDIPKLILLLGLGLFKLLFPIIAIIFWLIFFNNSVIILLVLLSPWIVFFIFYNIGFFFELKKKAKKVNAELGTDFSYWKAFRIVPLMFYVFGLINIRSYIRPRFRKWYN